MAKKNSRIITVLYDRNEQVPVKFPTHITFYPNRLSQSAQSLRVEAQKAVLDFGDYCLLGFEKCCVIERKASVDELAKNLMSADYKRSHSSLSRLVAGCSHPYLLLDESLPNFLRPTRYMKGVSSEAVVDSLITELMELKIPLLSVGTCRALVTRRRLGAFLVHLMLKHAVASQQPQKISVESLLTSGGTPPIVSVGGQTNGRT